jgi:hypothetical protein
MRRFVVTAGALIVMGGGAFMLGCGGDDVTGSAGPTVASCSMIKYGGSSYPAQCSIPGQAQQPSGLTITTGSVCLKVTCSSGCASSVALC